MMFIFTLVFVAVSLLAGLFHDRWHSVYHLWQIQGLLDLVQVEQNIYNIVFHEVIRQVSVECSERGQILAKLRSESHLLNGEFGLANAIWMTWTLTFVCMQTEICGAARPYPQETAGPAQGNDVPACSGPPSDWWDRLFQEVHCTTQSVSMALVELLWCCHLLPEASDSTFRIKLADRPQTRPHFFLNS